MLYGQLRELARKILEAPEGEMSSLQNDARVLYEKLTVLRYTEGLVEELKSSMDMATAVRESDHPLDDDVMTGDVKFSAQQAQQEKAVLQETEEATFSVSATRVEESIMPGDTWREEEKTAVTQDEETEAHTGGVVTVTATECIASEEVATHDIEEEIRTDLPAVQGEDTENDMRKEQKRKKTFQKEQYDELQQSLFDQDIFSKEIIGFDPDEDLFEINENTVSDSCAELEETNDIQGENTAEQFSGDDVAGSITEDDGEKEAKYDDDADDAGSFFAFEVVSANVETEEDESEDMENVAEQLDIDAELSDVDPDDAAGWQDEDSFTHGEDSGNVVAGMDESETPSEYADTMDKEACNTGQRYDEANGVSDDESPIGDDVYESEESDSTENDDVSPLANDEQVGLNDDNVAVQHTDAERIHTVNDTLSSEQPRLSLNEILASKNVSIGLNDRIAFINNLFDGDAEAFEASVKYIFSLSDIDVANEYIIEILKPSYNNWFEKEKYERRFVSLILQHFYKK